MSPMHDSGFLQRMQQVEALVARLEQCNDPATQAAARQLVQALLELHAAALEKVLGVLNRQDQQQVVERLAADDLVGSVLLLHELHPWPVQKRVDRAVARIRTTLSAQGGEVELLSLTAQAAHLRVTAGKGGCGCGSTGSSGVGETVKQAVRDAAPELAVVEVEVAEPAATPSATVPLTIEHEKRAL